MQIQTCPLSVFHYYILLCPSTAMAGNIIPAIATTNAIIAALIVMEGLKILSGNIEKCKTVSYLTLITRTDVVILL